MPQKHNKATISLFILRMMRMAITIVTLTFSAKFFGVDIERDVWVLTTTLIATITQAVWGPINEIFRTKFVFIREESGEEVAIRKTGSLVGFIFWVTISIGLLLFVLASPLSRFMVGNLHAGTMSLFVILLLFQLPSLLLNELTNIGISILNAYDVYYLPEIVGFFGGIVNLASIILFAPSWGIYSLLVGTYFGVFVLFFVVAYYLRKKDLRVWKYLIDIRWLDVKTFLLFALPFFFPYFIGQFNAIFEKILAGQIGLGNISSVEYARQFITVLQNVLCSVLTTIMVPLLAKQFINKQNSNFNQTLRDNIQICTLIYSAFSVFVVSSAMTICDFFFNRGKVNIEALSTITNLTQYYGIAFFFVYMYIIFGMGLLASNQGKYYATIGVMTQVLGFIINVIGCRFLGVYVFPVSFGLVHLLAAILMFAHGSYFDHNSIIRLLARSILIISLLLVLFYNINNLIHCESSLVKLIMVGTVLLLLLPILCMLLGLNIKSLVK